jgi:MoaA/NifB/PqqE/SkfB family radical SAM enzyme
MTTEQIEKILLQGKELGTLEWIYFEGGEPFLYYPVLSFGVELARLHGFKVGLVSNAYWATDPEDALTWLRPFVGKVEDLSISCDLYHSDEGLSAQASNAISAAGKLEIPVNLISVAQRGEMNGSPLERNKSALRYRGRAAEKLASEARLYSWKQFTSCPHEELEEPVRVHVDALGYVHVCQGISMGNLFRIPLKRIVEEYEPLRHPVIGPLIEGGPAALIDPELVRNGYADACHLCFEARRSQRGRFPEILVPDQMYGIDNS